ncbi:amino acid decarboxylase, partial [Alicyclobacillus sp.]|uniref:amino acid decarboxylase n=1 Tax=Alicyclobacillus sp. TaxID=61169 RepID=UPI0025C17C8A
HHPRRYILELVKDAPAGTLCEIHVPHRTGPLIAELENLGMNVAVAELEPGHFRLRVLKM